MDDLTITLPFPPSSNTAYPTVIRGRKPVRVKSKGLKIWIKKAPTLSHLRIHGLITISYKIHFPDDRIRDGQNFLKVPLDYIVSEGVIEDDNRRILKGEQWMDGGIDKKHPRIEIKLKKLNKTFDKQ